MLAAISQSHFMLLSHLLVSPPRLKHSKFFPVSETLHILPTVGHIATFFFEGEAYMSVLREAFPDCDFYIRSLLISTPPLTVILSTPPLTAILSHNNLFFPGTHHDFKYLLFNHFLSPQLNCKLRDGKQHTRVQPVSTVP